MYIFVHKLVSCTCYVPEVFDSCYYCT